MHDGGIVIREATCRGVPPREAVVIVQGLPAQTWQGGGVRTYPGILVELTWACWLQIVRKYKALYDNYPTRIRGA